MSCTDVFDDCLKSTAKISLKKLKIEYDIDDLNSNYILNQSYKLMPILFIQYKADFKMILEKIEEYQILLIDDKQIKKK